MSHTPKLHLVYSAITDYPIIGILILFLAVVSFALRAKYLAKTDIDVSLLRKISKDDLLPIIFIWLMSSLGGSIYFVLNYLDARSFYESDKMLTVEGRVTDFYPLPTDGKGFESFSVNGVEFTYSNNDTVTGYNNIATNGGVIKDGLYVKIGYSDDGIHNLILKLETE